MLCCQLSKHGCSPQLRVLPGKSPAQKDWDQGSLERFFCFQSTGLWDHSRPSSSALGHPCCLMLCSRSCLVSKTTGNTMMPTGTMGTKARPSSHFISYSQTLFTHVHGSQFSCTFPSHSLYFNSKMHEHSLTLLTV